VGQGLHQNLQNPRVGPWIFHLGVPVRPLRATSRPISFHEAPQAPLEFVPTPARNLGLWVLFHPGPTPYPATIRTDLDVWRGEEEVLSVVVIDNRQTGLQLGTLRG